MYDNSLGKSDYKSLTISDDTGPGANGSEEKWRWSSFSDEKGNIGFNRNVYPLQETSIVYGDTNGRLEILSKGASSTLTFIFVVKGTLDVMDTKRRRLQTLSAGNATSLIDRPDIKVKIYPGSSWVAYRVPITKLREYFERLMQRPYFQEQVFAPLHDFRSGGASALYQTVCYVTEDLATATNSTKGVLTSVYERLLLAKLFMTKPDNVNTLNNTAGRRIAPRYLQRAEAFMREHIHDPVTLDEIAEAAGCSPRALQRMFKEYRDTSPMHVLCEYRLSAAHEAILSGSARNVTDLAIHLQFSNPGRFSSLYRNAYGMSPSAMMRFHEKNT
ncbi:helix-turn-helix domain-containing protein [Phyllobacterium sp. 21LDTY02-6]|jgi:AraC-like DNA-binding protein|uniref:helix-turn-helix domain-containing protein n=1 Tax=Phyllobacterium sp. 21LDTY02-6 TaxID=2944903 RepID=UPI0020229080|nr:AraC family transcriptional regulator [Phyllobacterium sp. 21LDTY02-6]